MALTNVRIELAAEARETSDQANAVLEVFKEPSHKGYLFNVDNRPAIISVGYVGNVAVAAASCYERVIDKKTDDKAKAPFIGLPYLDIPLIATDSKYRRQGYGKQLVGSILNLAASHQFDRVEASQPSDDDAKLFWGACGFKFLPYESFGDYDMYRSTRCSVIEDIGVRVVVSPEVNECLSSFTQAQIAK